MFALAVRAAYAFVAASLFAAFLGFILGETIPIMQDAPDVPGAAQQSMVIGFFQSVQDWFIFGALLSILVLFLAGAVLQSRVGRGF